MRKHVLWHSTIVVAVVVAMLPSVIELLHPLLSTGNLFKNLFTVRKLLYIHSHVVWSDSRRGLNWILDLLTTYTHDSELQAITASPLIATIHKSPQHPLNFYSLSCLRQSFPGNGF
jgi:hypothetical protein